MKEFTIEQKAKFYDEAVKRGLDYIRHTPATEMVTRQDIFEAIFPELKESDDERIRKAIICGMNALKDQKKETFAAIPIDDCIAWLEKQGEQKHFSDFKAKDWYVSKVDGKIHNMTYNPTDKNEPKFKVGDWCIDNDDGTIFQIVKVLDNTYTYKTNEGNEYSCTHYSLENVAHLWTIKDAMDGDVLVADSRPFIYNGSKNEVTVGAYCGFNVKNKFSFAYNYVINRNITPATKEHRDLLFQKIKEAGYEWDREKKELKLLITNGGDFGPTWSEEDEERIKNIISVLDWDGTTGKKENPYQEEIDWLKSLKERCTWKPSDGQLECLRYAIEKAEKDWSPLTNNRIYLTLKALKEQLEKL